MDIILGMDWLTANHVVLDCFNKIINLASESMNLSKVNLDSLVSSTFLNQCLVEGHEGYILLLSSNSETSLNLTSVPIVNDVFPDEVVFLPPDHEVEFSIELVPDTGPNSITSYRMSPLDLKELKTQLEELIAKKLIRPSASPWGASMLLVKKKNECMRLYIDYR